MKGTLYCILLFLCSCNIDKKSVQIEQQDSNYQVEIVANDSIDRVILVYCHLVYDVQKLIMKKVQFYYPSQYENSIYSYYKNSWSGRPLEFDEYGKPAIMRLDDVLGMLSRKKTQYLVKTASAIDTSFAVQETFRPYLERMKAESKDTVHIGSIQQLKRTNPELIYNLLQRDSIKFVFGRDDKRYSIRMPIEVR